MQENWVGLATRVHMNIWSTKLARTDTQKTKYTHTKYETSYKNNNILQADNNKPHYRNMLKCSYKYSDYI